MLPNPGKPAHDVASYRPISLLPIPYKAFEKLHLKRLRSDVDLSHLIPGYEFGFRPGHSPIQHVHRIFNEIVTSLEERALCTAVFLDLAQAFDKCGKSTCCINWGPPSQAHTICSCSRTLPTVTSRYGIKACALTATRWGPVSPWAVFLAPALFTVHRRSSNDGLHNHHDFCGWHGAPGGVSWSCRRIPAPSEPLNPPPQLIHTVETRRSLHMLPSPHDALLALVYFCTPPRSH